MTRRADGSALIKVLDFGISKIDNDPQHISLTASTGAMGSPQYMSPEQMRSAKHVDRRTDIWAIGAILFELLTGHPPFEADSLIGLCTLVATKEAPPVRELVQDAPEKLSDAIARCLRREPDERYDTLADLAVDLMPFGSTSARTSAHRIVTILKDAGLADIAPPHSPSTPPPRLHDPSTDTVAIGRTAEADLFEPKPHSKGTRIAVVGGVAGVALAISIWVAMPKPSGVPTVVPESSSDVFAAAPDASNAAVVVVDIDAGSVGDASFEDADSSPAAVASASA